MSGKVYILVADCGEYSDKFQRKLGVFTDKATPERMIVDLRSLIDPEVYQQWANKAGGCYYETPKETMDKILALDPEYDDDDRPFYSVEEVDFYV